MKNTFLIAVIIFLTSCKTDIQPVINNEINTPTFSWLLGSWQRVDDQPGRFTYEEWHRTTEGTYLGKGLTLQDKDTVFQEALAIYKVDDLWVLEVIGVNESPTIFEIIEFSSTSFTAVNLKNEFPTHIEYSIERDSLKAIVYSKERSINYTFVK
ncbi:MAG: hypothetical protein ACSHWW_00175 [Nonlabens sp.]|uniref:hypothetical protein n=1 Tax=Nonlabens sp. TaxID=1888209 RepID=UPI003EFA1C72